MTIENLFQLSIEAKKIPLCKIKKIEKLEGDVGTREYYRLYTEEERYIISLNTFPSGIEGQKRFIEIQKVLKDRDICVPSIYDYHLEKGYILEEDLGNQTLLKALGQCQGLREEKEIYETAMEQMIKMQNLDLSRHCDKDFSKFCFDTAKLMEEVQFTVEHFIKGLLNYPLNKSEEKNLLNHFLFLVKKVVTDKMVFNHRDYHSRNIMVKENRQIVIDFQDARRGIPQYDLVSLLEDRYYDINSSNKNSLKDSYWNHFIKKKGLQSSKEHFYLLYDLISIQRIFKAMGNFAFVYQKRKNPRYLKYIGYSFENLKEFLYAHKDLNELRIILSSIYYGC